MKFDVNLGGIKTTVDVSPVEKYIKALPKLIRAFVVAMASSEVSPLLKIYALSGLTYFFSPLDILPDIFTGIGLVDDTILALLIIQAFLAKLDKKLLMKILDTDETGLKEIFFNVKEGTEVTAKFFGELYSSVRKAFDEIVRIYEKEKAKEELEDKEPSAKIMEAS